MTRILVVDDEPQILRALATNLRARKYEVEIAKGGFAAGVTAITQHAHCDPGDVVFVNRCRWSGQIRPAYAIAAANLRCPPVQGIRGENSGTKERPLKS